MKYKDNDKKGDSFLDRMIDDLIWGAPLGDGVGINARTGKIIPYPTFGKEDDDDWEKNEFSLDDDDEDEDESEFDDTDDEDDEYYYDDENGEDDF